VEKNTNCSIIVTAEKSLQIVFPWKVMLLTETMVTKWMRAPGYERKPQDWQLWIYSSKLSLKAVIHSGNDLLSTLLATLYTWKRRTTICNFCSTVCNIINTVGISVHIWEPQLFRSAWIKSHCFLLWTGQWRKKWLLCCARMALS
jgi:hypothetical protein